MKALFSTLILSLTLVACATSYNPRYRIYEIVINNNTREPVRDVTIRANNRVFSCGNIAPLGICSNRFAGYAYQTSTVDIEWSLGNDAPRRETLQVAVPATFSLGAPLRGVVEIEPQGRIDAYFRQDSPIP